MSERHQIEAGWFVRIAAMIAIAMATLQNACSRTNVDTGENGQTPDLTGHGESGSGSDAGGSCWSSPENTPETIRAFCDQTPSILRDEFAKALGLVCETRRVLNLLRPECGWNGSGNSLDHLRVLEATPVEDRGTDFYYVSAHALTAGPMPFSYPQTLALVATDVEAFKKAFAVPGGATITPASQGITGQGPLKTFRYNFAVNGLAKFGFTGEVTVLKVNEQLTAVFNRAAGDLEGLKARRNLTLVLRQNDNREKLLTIEERLVPDLGQHQIALAKMIKLDKIEMENRYQNSLVTNPPPELTGILD